MSIRDIAITMVWFQPLFAWLGLLTILLLMTTASYGYLLFKGKVRSLKAHMALAATTILLAFVHAMLAISTMI
ncbi:MAG TPA: hypothetical protein VMC84_02515 [Methanocella sp.]|uniref:hypothetical protein n=1 Tax=Methanocella sp. TaxID=2052833 RepID=UPI002C086EF4|nr:hypothetical protein [Methanocella sp.]HTY90027.1 hypothetical protein [Methanocella sp.]